MAKKDYNIAKKTVQDEILEAVGNVQTAVEGMETNLSGTLTANVVKSVQQGVINMKTDKKPITATINPVDTEKSVVLFNGSGSTSTSNTHLPYVQLTNSTTVSADSITAGSSSYPVVVGFTVLEFY